jgi:hypothetical protein
VGAIRFIRRIRRTQQDTAASDEIRPFILAAIDFTAENFWEITKFNVDEDTDKVLYWTVKETWDEVTEPPITMKFTDEELGRFMEEPLRTGYCCHTQAVERMVAMTTRAASNIAGQIRQIGEAMAIIDAIDYIPGRVVRKTFEDSWEDVLE